MRICPQCFARTEAATCPADGTTTVDEGSFVQSDSGAGDGLVGLVISGRYCLTELLGHGGMGTVYKANQLAMDREVAVKILKRSLAADKAQVGRFHREAMASSRLTHPNTIRIFDFGQTQDGSLYIVMELLKGISLKRLLDRAGSLPVDRTIEIVLQIAKSLGEAHSHGIVHRDLKPENIFLTHLYGERDFVKVLDFGIAKFVQTGDTGEITKSGVVVGTPEYMSPEHVMGKPVDGRSDLYSLGVMMFQLLTGRVPFISDSDTAILFNQITEKAPRLAEVVPDKAFPASLEALLAKLLMKDRRDRYATAAELIAALKAIDIGPVVEERTGKLSKKAIDEAIMSEEMAHKRDRAIELTSEQRAPKRRATAAMVGSSDDVRGGTVRVKGVGSSPKAVDDATRPDKVAPAFDQGRAPSGRVGVTDDPLIEPISSISMEQMEAEEPVSQQRSSPFVPFTATSQRMPIPAVPKPQPLTISHSAVHTPLPGAKRSSVGIIALLVTAVLLAASAVTFLVLIHQRARAAETVVPWYKLPTKRSVLLWKKIAAAPPPAADAVTTDRPGQPPTQPGTPAVPGRGDGPSVTGRTGDGETTPPPGTTASGTQASPQAGSKDSSASTSKPTATTTKKTTKKGTSKKPKSTKTTPAKGTSGGSTGEPDKPEKKKTVIELPVGM